MATKTQDANVTVPQNQPVVKEDGSAEIRPYQILQRQLAMEASQAAKEFNGFELAADAIDRVWEADSVDDVWEANDAGGLESLKDSEHLHNVPLLITGYRPIKGDDKYEESSLGYFAAFDAMEVDGTFHTVSCGAPQIVAMLAKLDQKDAWPQRVIFRTKGTVRGFKRLTIERAPEPKTK
jgi:hypothetical protein